MQSPAQLLPILGLLIGLLTWGQTPGAPRQTADAQTRSPLGERHRRMLDSASRYRQTDVAKSLDYITRSIDMLDARDNERELARSLTALGQIYQDLGQYDLAISNFEEALQIRETSQRLVFLGRAYVLDGNYDRALDLLLREADRKGLRPEQRLELFEILGDAYSGKEEVDAAVPHYQQALTIAEKNQLSSRVPPLLSKIARAYDRADRLVEAEAFYGDALREARALGPAARVRESEKVADFFRDHGRYAAEIAERKKSLEGLRSLGRPVSVPGADSITQQAVDYKIGTAYLASSRVQEAIPFLTRSIREARVSGDLLMEAQATRRLSEIYRAREEYRSALDLYQRYVALLDTLNTKKQRQLLGAARVSGEMASSQDRIRSLEQERELSRSKYNLALAEQRLTRESNKKQRVVIYSLIVGFLLMAVAAFFYYRSNRQKVLANHLLALKGLRSQMNPHFIFNALNSVNHYIAQNNEREANRYLSEFSHLMRTVLENSEKDFIPLKEELELLRLYLKLEHARFPEKFDYEIAVDPGVEVTAYEIPPMLLQPFLENAVWHGLRYKEEKGRLLLSVKELAPGVLQIEISDNGIGRKRSQAVKTSNQLRRKSRGMGNIRKRIEILNQMYGDRITVDVRDLKPDGTGTRVITTLRSR